MIFHPGCEGPGCGWCAGYLRGWAAGNQVALDEIEARLTTEHEGGCYCTPCRVVMAVGDAVDSQTWSSAAACPYDCRPFPHQLDCPVIALDTERLLRHLQERRADPPEYFTVESIAEGSGVAGPDVALLMRELFPDAWHTHDGYPAADVFETLDDLTPSAG